MKKRIRGRRKYECWGDFILDRVKINDSTGCWEWRLFIDRDGYGISGLKNRSQRAHRVSFEIFYNVKVPSHLLICHSCDNRKCVNPKHLFMGDLKDNYNDMYFKKRGPHQEKRGLQVLSKETILKIRKEFVRIDGQKSNFKHLMKKYNISYIHAYKIVNKLIWKDI